MIQSIVWYLMVALIAPSFSSRTVVQQFGPFYTREACVTASEKLIKISGGRVIVGMSCVASGAKLNQ